jgi:hypothetical protein
VAVRTALALFATSWVLIQVASALLLVFRYFEGNLEPAADQVVNVVLSLAFGVGIVYFVTGMAMACRIPPQTGAKLLGWGIVGSLALSAAFWILFNVAAYQNQEIVREIAQEIQKAQKRNPKAGPPTRQRLEQELARQWGPELLKSLVLAFLGCFCLAKLLFTALLGAVARSFQQPVLASCLVIYLLGEALAMAVALSIVFRQPVQWTLNIPFAVFTGNWYSVAATSAFCTWFLVNLVLVRRTIKSAALGAAS